MVEEMRVPSGEGKVVRWVEAPRVDNSIEFWIQRHSGVHWYSHEN
jgi:hypothetical protein